jgi:hypothetical protein
VQEAAPNDPAGSNWPGEPAADDSSAASPIDPAATAPPVDPSDGAPERRVYTNTLGAGLTRSFGRLDGRLVAVVKRGARDCNGDSTHVHLQVEAAAATYDIAVNIDGLTAEVAHSLAGGAWSEGWHAPGTLDYVRELGLRAPAFASTNAATLEQRLSSANHVSIFASGYGPDGAHLVHRNSGGRDGAIVLNPLSAQPRYLVFRFATQSF